jgi:hypothetical protein
MIGRSVDLHQSRRGVVSILLAGFLALAIISPAAAARPAPAWSCALNPGDTRVIWRSYPQTTQIDIEWFDSSGAVIGNATVAPANGKPVFTLPTPVGAAEVGVHFFDATGEFGVGGGGCV